MKRFLPYLLALLLLVSSLSFSAMAEEVNYAVDLMALTERYYFFAEFVNGYFAVGEAPKDVDAALFCVEGAVRERFPQYVLEGDYFLTEYEIPADEFEALFFEHFTESDAMRQMLRSSENYIGGDAPHYVITMGGGFGGPLPDVVFQGYRDLGNGIYEAYAYLAQTYVDDIDFVPYEPAEGEVEGVDYIRYRSVSNNYVETDDGNWVVESTTVSYLPGKLMGVVHATFTANDKGGFAYTGYEKLENTAMPALDTLMAPKAEEVPAVIGPVSMAITPDTFPADVAIRVEAFTEGVIHEWAKDALSGRTDKLTVFEFHAWLNDEAVQPNEPFAVIFPIPEGFSDTVKVFYVSEDGRCEELPTTVDSEKRTATALLSHFSTYVVADVSESVSKEPTGPCSSESLPADTVDGQTTDTVDTDSQTENGTEPLPETDDEAPAFMLPALGVIAVAVVIAGIAVVFALNRRNKR
jgi:hypothetical protein